MALVYFIIFFACVFVTVAICVALEIESVLLMMVFTIVLFSLLVFIIDKIVSKKERPYRFYSECISNGIVDIEDKFQQQKAILIAQQYGCESYDIVSYYNYAKELSISREQKNKNEAEKAAYKNMRYKETQTEQKLTKYASYFGREKRIAMLTDRYWYCNKQANSKARMAEYAPNVFLEKEKDWATHAGIANGLAGGAAAVLVAADVERENAQIRERNKNKTKMVTHVMSELNGSAQYFEDQAKFLAEEKSRAELALVENKPNENIFSCLKIDTETVSISETGAVHIIAKITNQKESKIGKNDAVIDGVINAKVYQNDVLIGVARLTLPMFGIAYHQTIQLEGISLVNAKQDVSCKIVYEPHNLWIIER